MDSGYDKSISKMAAAVARLIRRTPMKVGEEKRPRASEDGAVQYV